MTEISRDPLRLVDVRDDPLSLDEVHRTVRHSAAGGTALFIGTVRDQDGGRDVTRLGYSTHPQVLAEMQRVARRVVTEHPVLALAAVHRQGELAVGDIAVIVAVACAHRDAAFTAARQLVEGLKHEVPIWKHQHFADGDDEWVGA